MPNAVALVWDLAAKDSASPAFLRVAGAADKAAAATARAEKGVAGSMAAMSRTGAKLTKGLTVPLLGLAAVGVEQAAKYSKSLNTIQNATGQTNKQMTASSKGLLDIAKSTGTGLSQLTDGLYTVEKGGLRGAKALATVKAAAQGAKAENADMGVVTNALTSIMASYGKKIGSPVQAMNMLVRGSGLAKVSLQDFSSSLATVVPLAAKAGIGFDQVAGAIDTLTQHGTSAQEATQELANLIRNLQKPSQVAQKAMGQVGLSVNQLSLNLGKKGANGGLIGTLNMVENAVSKHLGKSGLVAVDTFKKSANATADLSKMISVMPAGLAKYSKGLLDGSVNIKDYQKSAKALGGQAGASGLQFLSLYKSSKGFNDLLKSGQPAQRTAAAELSDLLGGSTALNAALQLGGHSAKYFADSSKSVGDAAKHAGTDVLGWSRTQGLFTTKVDIAKENLQVLAVEVGTALIPILTKVVGWVSKAVNWFDNLGSGTKKTLLWAAGITAALGPLMSIFGRFYKLGSLVVTGGSRLIGFFTGTGTAATIGSREVSTAMASQTRAVSIAVEEQETMLAGLARQRVGMGALPIGGAAMATRTATAEGGAAASRGGFVSRAGSRMSMGGLMAGTGLAIGGQALASGQKAGSTRSRVGGVLKDAGYGAMIGSLGGPLGTIAGGAIGGVYGAVTNRTKGDISSKTINKMLADVKSKVAARDTATQTASRNAAVAAARAQNILTAATTQTSVAVGDQNRKLVVGMAAQSGLTAAVAKGGFTQKDITSALTGSAAAYDRTVGAMRRQGAASAGQLGQIAHLRSAYINSAKALLNVQGQGDLFTKKLGVMTGAIAQNGKTLDQNTYFGKANRSAIASAAITAENHARAVYAQTGSIGKANGALRNNVADLENAAQAAGLNKKQVDALVRSTLGVKSKHAQMTVNTAGIPALKQAAALVNGAQSKTISFNVKTFGGSTLQAAIDAVNSMPSATPRGYTPQKTYAHGKRYAQGGTVPPNTTFTVGEQGWEGGRTDAQGRATIFSNPVAKAMGFKTPNRYASGTSSYGAIAKLLAGMGATRAGIAGFLGNTSAESGGRAGISQIGGPAHGLQQWQGGRFAELQSIAARMHTTWRSQAAQLAMIKHELTGGYKGTLHNLQRATSASAAADYVNRHYEISADTSGNRARLAQRFYKSGVSNAAGGTVNGITYSSATAARNAEVRARQALSKSAVTLALVASRAGVSADAMKTATTNLEAAAKKTNLSARALSGLSKAGAYMNTLAARRGSIAARLGAPAAKDNPTAYARLEAAQTQYNDLRSSVSSAVTGTFDITSAGASQYTDRAGTSSYSGMFASLKTAVANSKTFATVLGTLRKLGLNPTLLSQLASAGPAALPQAQALAVSSRAQVGVLNGQYKSLGFYANAAGSTAAGGLYGAGVATAQGLVKGLLSQEKALDQAVSRMARNIEKQVKRDLKIHSPSLVMHRLGAHTGEGFRLGIESSIPGISETSAQMGKAVMPGAGSAGAAGGTTNNNYITINEATDPHVAGAVVLSKLAMLART